MERADVAGLWRGQVSARARALEEEAEQARAEWREARAQKLPLPYLSVRSGRDLSYVLDAARRWRRLADEMHAAGVGEVSELGPERVAYWEAQLGASAPVGKPLVAAERPAPRVARHSPQRARPPRRPSAG